MRALLALLFACSAPARPPILENTQLATAPAPTVARGGIYGLTTVGLPAVAADGSRIVAAFRESDGQRGMPNLTLVIKDRRDTETDRHVVLSVAEADQFLDDAEGNNAPLAARITRANDWLAKRRWELLLVLDPEPTPIPADRTKASRGGVTASWERSHLRITDGVATLVDIDTPASWLPEQSKVGTNVCARSPYLGGAAIDRANKLAVITISYTADSDFCLEPPDQHHVITW
ncbi:MAG: hypothetical protein M4D80_36590 [Myxococcota bacterium]|nr:hypothetical protein [Deltaproteobacteria bacterium]MDQ3340710.1 hypothetical protein [Myxococcota bacterium]